MRRIAFDIDDVTAPFNGYFVQYWNNKYNTTYRLKDITHYNYEIAFQCSLTETIETVHSFYETPMFKSILPFNSAKIAASILYKRDELYIITGRAVSIADFTCEWLQRHFNGIFAKENIYFKNTYTRNGLDEKITKAHICKDLGIDIIIEDNLKAAKSCAEHGVSAFLIERPWNKNEQNFQIPNLIRVRTWAEIKNTMRHLGLKAKVCDRRSCFGCSRFNLGLKAKVFVKNLDIIKELEDSSI